MAQENTAKKEETKEQYIARLMAENEALRAQIAKGSSPRSLTLKVGQSGGMSVYGLGRFPVTLYKEQWARLFAEFDNMKAFIKDHDGQLKAKGD